MKISASFLSALNDESGQDIVEYGLLMALVALFAIAAVSSVANAAISVLGSVGLRLTGTV